MIPDNVYDDNNVDGEKSTKEPTQAQRLIQLALTSAELFHSPDKVAYVTIEINGHQETMRLRSKTFRGWLVREFFLAEDKPPGSQAMTDAIQLLDARAVIDGVETEVYLRVAPYAGNLLIDLGSNSWKAIRVTADGWKIDHHPPVKFRRAPGMLPLPVPAVGGDIDMLREFVNIESEDDFRLLVAFMLAALRPTGPFPILVLLGEQGSAKSTTVRVIRSLIDPSSAPIRTRPREERDLMVSANSGWVMAFDNISTLPDWFSDALCRLSTGGGLSIRQLYTDADEMLFDAMRPSILNGISDPMCHDDLRDRALVLSLPRIDDSSRRDEQAFWAKFQKARRQLFGALLDLAAGAIAEYPTTFLKASPRMADFAKWSVALETAARWPAGSFLDAYASNRAEQVRAFVEADYISSHLLDFMEDRMEWTGTPTDLYDRLADLASDTTKRQKAWPKSANVLGKRLREAAPSLNRSGIEIVFPRGTVRTYAISRNGTSRDSVVGVVGVVANPEKTGDLGLTAGATTELDLQTDMTRPTTGGHLLSPGNPRENGRKNDKDDTDDRVHPLSNGEAIQGEACG
ncbi:MAG: hypothetical protein IID05_08670 [Gemmatimonadetes bacterium]|nr:hypothetical protein [Gemmatimonadota bacterium]